MKQPRKIPGILIYLLILFFSVIGFVYALNTATNEQQIIETGGPTGPQDGVTISKVISPTDTENFFDITLTVETTSEIKNITTYPDLAVVIVMDISNTMATDLEGTTTSRLEAAQDAAGVFIEKFAEEAAKTPALREIGFVAFNTDANLIFDLQDCEDGTKAEKLKTLMVNQTNSITEKTCMSCENYKYRFTNIEGGLYRAKKMLSQSSATNKFIVFLSDGLPTTYLNKSNDNDDINSDKNYDGYDTYMSDSIRESKEGNFYNEDFNLPALYGTSYSDRGAVKAREMASSIKSEGIKIYSIGVGIDDQTTVEEYYETDRERYEKDGNFAVVDIEKGVFENKSYEVGTATPQDKSNYKKWLKNTIGSGVYHDTSDAEGIMNAYNEIFKTIQEQLQTSTEASWVANDPMGALVGSEKIEFIGFYDDTFSEEQTKNTLYESIKDYNDDGSDNTIQKNTASFNNSNAVINWDLKNSTYDETYKKTTENGEITYYKYVLRYRVRLKNEINKFEENHEYKTNGTTSLTYAVLESNGILSENKTLTFEEPSVKGYLGEFKFTKYSSYGNRVMEGVEFKLVHNPNCTRHEGFQNMTEKTVTIPDMVATSDENGVVSFTNIPSGHEYILKEIKAPADHKKADDVDIIVAYNEVYGAPGDEGIINPIQRGTLEITKQVEGNNKFLGPFKFEIEIKFNGSPLIGKNYNYKIYNADGSEDESKAGSISGGKGEIELSKDQKCIIENIPVGATYTLKELTTNGYKVQYQINEKDIETGDTATCNSSNSCRIENGSNNKVLFINTAGYILPATGDSGMLILIIIASLLIIGPIIDIGYMFYKYRKEDKLTS